MLSSLRAKRRAKYKRENSRKYEMRRDLSLLLLRLSVKNLNQGSINKQIIHLRAHVLDNRLSDYGVSRNLDDDVIGGGDGNGRTIWNGSVEPGEVTISSDPSLGRNDCRNRQSFNCDGSYRSRD